MKEDWCHSWGCGAAAWPLWQEHVPLRSGCCCDSRWCHSSGQQGQLPQEGQPHCPIDVTTLRSPLFYSRLSGREMCEDVCIRNWDKTCFLGCHYMEWLNVWLLTRLRGERQGRGRIMYAPSHPLVSASACSHPYILFERGNAGMLQLLLGALLTLRLILTILRVCCEENVHLY